MFRPLPVENKDGMAGSSDCLALSPVLLLESINGNDVPRPICRQVPNPGKVRRIALETIGQMDDLLYSVIFDNSLIPCAR